MEVCVPYIADTCVTETGATNPICSQVVVTGADDAAKQTLCGSKSYATGKKCVYAPGRAAGTNNNVGDCTALEKVDRECKCGKVGGDANGAVQYIKPTDNKVCSAAGAAADSKAISPCATTKYHVKEPTKSSGAGPECACPKTATEYNLISSHATNMPICKPQTLATCKTVDGLTNDANCSAVDVTLAQAQKACENTSDVSGLNKCVYAAGSAGSVILNVGNCTALATVTEECKCGVVNGTPQYIKPTDNKVCSAGGAAADSKAIPVCALDMKKVAVGTSPTPTPFCACPEKAYVPGQQGYVPGQTCQYTLLEKVNSNAKVCVPFVAPKCVTETGATNAKCSQVASPSPTNCSNKYYAPGKKCAYHKGVDSSTADAGNLPNCSGTDSPTHECVCNTTANSETYLLPGSTKRCSAPGVGGELVDVCNKTNGEKPTGTTGEKCWCKKTATKHDFATIGTDTCKTDVNTAASCKDQHGYDGDANCSAVDVTLYQGQDATACTNTMDESGVACVATFASGNNPSAEVVGDCVGKTKVERTCKCGKVV